MKLSKSISRKALRFVDSLYGEYLTRTWGCDRRMLTNDERLQARKILKRNSSLVNDETLIILILRKVLG